MLCQWDLHSDHCLTCRCVKGLCYSSDGFSCVIAATYVTLRCVLFICTCVDGFNLMMSHCETL